MCYNTKCVITKIKCDTTRFVCVISVYSIESLYKMNSELVKKVSELTSLLSIANLDKSNESDIEPIEPEFIISNKPLLKRKPKGNRN